MKAEKIIAIFMALEPAIHTYASTEEILNARNAFEQDFIAEAQKECK